MAHILIIDHVKDNTHLLHYFLNQNDHKTTITAQGRDALDLACQLQPDVILLNTTMPDINGLAVLQQLKKNPASENIPVIMLVAKDDIDDLSAYFDSDAHDYLAYPFNKLIVGARVSAAALLKRSQDQLVHSNAKLADANQRLEHIVTTDTLTQLLNRNQFYKLAAIEISKAKRFSNSLTTVIVDADKLQHLNSTYGHTMGDEALHTIAEICRNNTRDIDIIGRLGSAEIAICCAQTSLVGGLGLAERIRNALENTVISDHQHTTTLSISSGVSELQHEDSIDTLINRTAENLRRAKELGRNRVCTDSES